MAVWRSGNVVGDVNEVAVSRARLVPVWDDRLRRATRYLYQPPRPTQPPTFSVTENEYQPNCSDALRLGNKAGWFIPRVDKRVGAGKTV